MIDAGHVVVTVVSACRRATKKAAQSTSQREGFETLARE